MEELQLRLGDLVNDSSDQTVQNIVQFMLDKTNAPKWISSIQGESLGSDPNYALSEPVGSNVAVMDKHDNYVSVVTSLNTWFGSKVMLNYFQS